MQRQQGNRPGSRQAATLEGEILRVLQCASPQALGLRELVRRLEPCQAERAEVRAASRRMAAAGTIRQVRGRKYLASSTPGQVTGIFRGCPEGYGFVRLGGHREEEIFIKRGATQGAMHGDRVVARVLPRERGRRGSAGRCREGRVAAVLEKANRRVPGRFERAGRTAVVVPADPRLFQKIEVPRGAEGGAKHGQMVVVEIIRYPVGGRNAHGAVVEVLGYPDDEGVELEVIIRKHDLAAAFPENVLAGAERAAARMTSGEVGRRLDLRDQIVMTIDGETARDFDDAVSIGPAPAGGYRLGVHIADVSFFVSEGSALEIEAFRRGTSVYFPGRVLPMLPPALSSGICSLNPAEDRLAVSVLMEFDPYGTLRRYEFHDTVIRSAARLTYGEVAKVLDGQTSPGISGETRAALRMMGRLAKTLRERRLAEESLDLDIPEAEVELGLDGTVKDVRKAPRTAAHMLIEEFMLAANSTVANHLAGLDAPCVWRVHDRPDPEDMREFELFARSLGYKAAGLARPRATTLQRLLEGVHGTGAEASIHIALLRSMKRAMYAARNAGHFALGFDNYVHFTSPIRRYPDVLVHRVLRQVRKGEAEVPGHPERLKQEMEEVAERSTERQWAAESAEREMVDLCRARLMQDRIGEQYRGCINAVTCFGFFVELEAPFVEGLVPVASLGDDRYEFIENRRLLVGKRSGRTFRIGDAVRVEVANVSVERREIEFALAANESG